MKPEGWDVLEDFKEEVEPEMGGRGWASQAKGKRDCGTSQRQGFAWWLWGNPGGTCGKSTVIASYPGGR
jgi:hypothetical protein